MTVINLIDKSKLRALERRCNTKEMAENVMSFLTVTTLRRLPASAHGLFRHSIRTHYNGDEDLMSTGQVALDKCQQIPLAFIPQPNEKNIESETETECDRDTTNDSDAKGKTETVQVKGALRWWAVRRVPSVSILAPAGAHSLDWHPERLWQAQYVQIP